MTGEGRQRESPASDAGMGNTYDDRRDGKRERRDKRSENLETDGGGDTCHAGFVKSYGSESSVVSLLRGGA